MNSKNELNFLKEKTGNDELFFKILGIEPKFLSQILKHIFYFILFKRHFEFKKIPQISELDLNRSL